MFNVEGNFNAEAQRGRDAEKDFNAKVQRGKGRKEQREEEKRRRREGERRDESFVTSSLSLFFSDSLRLCVKLPLCVDRPLQSLRLEELPLH
jgi:hypothetical protein